MIKRKTTASDAVGILEVFAVYIKVEQDSPAYAGENFGSAKKMEAVELGHHERKCQEPQGETGRYREG